MAISPAAPACIVLAHEDPSHVRRLVEALDPFPVFLHCDARTPETVFRAMTDGLPDRVRLLPRIRTGWAKWENVAAEVEGYRAALAETDATHVAVLTGSDYPLAHPDEVRTLLEAHREESFIATHPLPYPEWGRDGGVARIRYRHWAWRKQMLRLPVPRRVPRDVVFAGGSQLKVLARRHASAVVDAVDSRPDLVRFWRRTWVADETFVPSVLSSPALTPGFDDEHVPHGLWWIGWDGTARKSPPWLTTADAGRLLEHRTMPDVELPHVFARKFSTARSSDLLDVVDGAFGLRPGAVPAVSGVVAP
ncbi:beta-1,6-N-acetylglucosaminyltransferase [Curtobacterium sp. MCPF17_002]|uniref:beta-1,6-N-acetylglucosaminyltransferase n=1 Tax=Curtobacterium sp. MCPF17_002 TaxID=2175645 RepID=UPI000DAA4665|nr:beta-1,6-N-acetylglucosaminyltransferase [Curtobacterium sp. MCPF17_002]WIB76270.1 beta-1,6-N-acetylglucosaminyltransferase [Curtobacterium sp. MCPF17_002]